MKNSELLKIIADANRRCGYTAYADSLEKAATVKAAEEICQEGGEDEQQDGLYRGK